jgi:hypothetical protein
MSWKISNESLGTNYYNSIADDENLTDTEEVMTDSEDESSPFTNETEMGRMDDNIIERRRMGDNITVEGQWINGLPVGQVRYIYDDGRVIEGFFGSARIFQPISQYSNYHL